MGRITQAVAEQAGADTAQAQNTATLLETIVASESLFATALNGTDIDPVQFVSNAINVVKQDLRDPDKPLKIIEAEPDSVIGALLNCAQYGLRPGTFKEAWIIPKMRRGVVLAEFQAHYRGLQRMAQAHPDVLRVTTRVVHEHDEFTVSEGSNMYLKFEPKVDSRSARGRRIAFFTLAVLSNDETPFVWWHDADMVAFRDRFVKAKRGPWYDAYGFEAMGRKTVLLRLLDEIPRQNRLVDLVAVDGTVRRDLNPATPGYEVGERIDDNDTEGTPPEPQPINLDVDDAPSGTSD